MKIFGRKNNVYDAVDSVVQTGVAAISGTKTPAVEYANRVLECLEPYAEIEALIDYQNVPNNGYLYYVYDSSRFHGNREELERIIKNIDAHNA